MKTKFPYRAVLAVSGLFASVATPTSAAVFANGNFDGYISPTNNTAIGTFSPTSWVAFGTSTNVQLKTAAAAGLAAQSGSSFVAIFGTSADNTGFSQTFDTVVGQQYSLSYWLGTQNAVATGPTVTIDLFDGSGFGGTSLGVDSTDVGYGSYRHGTPSTGDDTPWGATWGQDTWKQFTLNFTAMSDTSTLRFMEATGSTTSSADIFVDNVVITAVPEPSSMAMAASCALIGLTRRRRNRR